MSMTKYLRTAVAIAVLAACGNAFAQDPQSAPSVDSIIDSLKADARVAPGRGLDGHRPCTCTCGTGQAGVDQHADQLRVQLG